MEHLEVLLWLAFDVRFLIEKFFLQLMTVKFAGVGHKNPEQIIFPFRILVKKNLLPPCKINLFVIRINLKTKTH